ncbi:unnamed protein product [Symbiodinium sp. KB8]|nr:unnamed protein product [Symbiodinium sp. KB8]
MPSAFAAAATGLVACVLMRRRTSFRTAEASQAWVSVSSAAQMFGFWLRALGFDAQEGSSHM